MYLLLDLSAGDAIHLALFSASTYTETRVTMSNRELLCAIDAFLLAETCTKTDIRGMMVVVGAGRFTSTRIAATIANTWAYAQGIPVLAIPVEDCARVQALIPSLEQSNRPHYLSAIYSAAPRLG